MRVPVLALVSALLAAGCVAPTETIEQAALEGLVEPLYEKLLLENDRMPARDGAELDSWVVRPETPPGTKVPVLILASPYNQALSERAERLLDSEFVKFWATRGYAVVFHSVRGTGDSEGCFDLGGSTEQEDLVDLVERFGAAEWSNGNVALYGVSYVGTTPWEAAIHNPPHLKAIIPVSGISDMYRYMYFEGAGYWIGGDRGGGGATFPSYYYPSVDWGLPVLRGSASGEIVEHAPEALCQDAVDAIAKGYETQLAGAHDAFWDERDYSVEFPNITAAVFLVHGLQDWNVKPDHAEPAFGRINAPYKAWLGQWEHNIPWRNTFNEDWSRADWNATMQSFLDHHLLGRDNGFHDGPAVEVQDNHGDWRTEEAWPPERAFDLALWPDASGGLAAQAPEDAVATFLGVPGTVPGPRAWSPEGPPSPPGSYVTFSTEPLASDLRVAGSPSLVGQFVRDRPGDGHLVFAIFDVDPSGKAVEIDRGFLNLRQWESRDTSSEPPIGAPFGARVKGYPQDLLVPAGHKLALSISGDHAEFLSPAPSLLRYDVLLGEDGARLVLPVLPEADGGLRDVDASDPASGMSTSGSKGFGKAS